MRNINEDVEQFLKIVHSQYPELEGKIEYSLEVSFEPKRAYELDLRIPIDYRDRILPLTKFCNLGICHEFHDSREGIIIFQSDTQIF